MLMIAIAPEEFDDRLVDRSCVLLVHRMGGVGDFVALDDRQQLFEAVGQAEGLRRERSRGSQRGTVRQ